MAAKSRSAFPTEVVLWIIVVLLLIGAGYVAYMFFVDSQKTALEKIKIDPNITQESEATKAQLSEIQTLSEQSKTQASSTVSATKQLEQIEAFKKQEEYQPPTQAEMDKQLEELQRLKNQN